MSKKNLKKDLFNKLLEMNPKKPQKLDITEEERAYIKDKLLNDKLGLKLNFTEIDRKEERNYILLKEIERLGINKNKNCKNNLLIEGDNYHALKALRTAGVKVDVIYIDPPYNTGNRDFMYDDGNGKPKYVKSGDPYKHSKWLSFIKKRLKLAKDMMKERGVIFASIDDNEHAYMKVLMDEIFGEENFSYNFCVKMKDGGLSGSQITNSHEYILMYTKNRGIRLNEEACQGKIKLEDWNKNNKVYYYGLTNEKYLQMEKVDINEDGAFDTKIGDLEFIEKIGTELFKKHLQKYRYIFRFTNPQSTRSKRIIKKIKNLPNNQFISWKVDSRKNKGSNTTYFGKYNGASSPLLFDNEGYILQKISTIWTDISTAGLANEGGVNLKNGKKPVKLIKRLVDLHPDKNGTILDFFAGSGTTGQAVMELNEEDGGKRRFILCTNNEMGAVDTKKYPEKGIAREICRERIYIVINGKSSKKEMIKRRNSKKAKSLPNNSLSYLEVKLLDKYDGDFEDIDKVKKLYKKEFDKNISIQDFME